MTDDDTSHSPSPEFPDPELSDAELPDAVPPDTAPRPEERIRSAHFLMMGSEPAFERAEPVTPGQGRPAVVPDPQAAAPLATSPQAASSAALPPAPPPSPQPPQYSPHSTAFLMMGSEPAFERAEPRDVLRQPYEVEPDSPGAETLFLRFDSAYDRSRDNNHNAAAMSAAQVRAALEEADRLQRAMRRAEGDALSATPRIALSRRTRGERMVRQRPVRHSENLYGTMPALSGLRTYALAVVVVNHVAYWTGHVELTLAGGTADWLGSLGAAVFMVLSGFLLFREWLRGMVDRAPDGSVGPTPRFRGYVWHRFRRIVPPYVVVVLLTYVALLTRHGPEGMGPFVGQLWRQLTFTQCYGRGHYVPGLSQVWALCVMVAFYVLLPVLGWVCVHVINRQRFRALTTLLFLLGVGLVTPVWGVVTRRFEFVDVTSQTWLPAYFMWFVVGMMMAVLTVRVPRYRESALTVSAFVVGWTALACYVAIAMVGEDLLVADSFADALWRGVFAVFAVSAFIMPLVFGDPQGDAVTRLYHRCFTAAPVMWLSKVSYEFFLLHVLVLEGAMRVLGYSMFSGNMAIVLVVVTAVTLPMSWLLRWSVAWIR